MTRYQGRRFAAFLTTLLLVGAGFFAGPPENFGTFAQVIGALFFTYVTGQSATDWKKAQKDVG